MAKKSAKKAAPKKAAAPKKSAKKIAPKNEKTQKTSSLSRRQVKKMKKRKLI